MAQADSEESASAPNDADIVALGEVLAGRPVRAVAPARAGGNNRVHRIECDDGTQFALKVYPPQAADPRDRLGAEFAALSFLGAHGIAGVPRAVAADAHRHCALYSWIEGTPVSETGPADLDALAGFLIGLSAITDAEDAAGLRPASAGCLRPAAAVEQFEERLARLRDVAPGFPEVARFVEEDLVPGAGAVIARAGERLTAAGVDAHADIAPGARTLSPSDFGFHNALRRADGTLAFLDFEYFGWDDPAKMIADVRLHPGMNLTEAAGARVCGALERHFDARDPAFNPRFRFLLPVCGLIWCLILLNEFLPERWTRRTLAGRPADAPGIRARQLEKARTMLKRVQAMAAAEATERKA